MSETIVKSNNLNRDLSTTLKMTKRRDSSTTLKMTKNYAQDDTSKKIKLLKYQKNILYRL